MENQTKERRITSLQLRAALQSRLTPDLISASPQKEVATDLLKFMEFYNKLVSNDGQAEEKKWNDGKEAESTHNGRDKIRAKHLKPRSRSIDRLEWKLAQRITLNEMAARSIIPAEYIPTINTEKEYAAAEQEKQSHFLSTEEKLQRKMELKTRPTPQELFQRGVLVEPSLSDPEIVDRIKAKRRNIRKKFAKKYRERMGKDEAIQRNIVDKEEFEKDHEKVKEIRKEERSALKNKLIQRVSERPNRKEIVQRAIVDEQEFNKDHEEVLSSKKQHRRAVTAQLGEKMKQRPKPGQVSELRHLDEDASDEDADADADLHVESGGRRSANQSSLHSNKYLNDSEVKRQQHKQLKTLDTFLQRRIDPKEMEARHIVPRGYWDNPIEAINKQRQSLQLQKKALFAKIAQRGLIRSDFLDTNQ
ncbi:hypothetical protein RFI_12990, partial [Reticulomyxa filosa]